MEKLKVIISGGGTGGHIFPAIAIAKALEKKVKNIEILFVGAKGRMEMTKIPAEGYSIEGLWISGLQRKLTAKNISFPFKVISSLLRARKIIKKFNLDPKKTILIEDIAHNLKQAKSLGMKTVWLENSETFASKDKDRPYIDYKIKNLSSFLQEINILKTV